jgi:type II secretory pathway component HofQ
MCEKGARRNYEKWRDNDDEKFQEETQEETLDRLERERGEEHEQQERDKMADLEDKMKESKREMQIADALDEIRTRNARIERNEAATEKPAVIEPAAKIDDEEARFEAEIAERARKAFRDEDGVLVKRLSPEEEALLNQPIVIPEVEEDGFDWGNPRAWKRKRDAERAEAKKKQFPWKIVRPSEQKKRPA